MSTSIRPSLDAEISAIALVQHGAFTRAQALSLGASPRSITHRIARGRWDVRHAGVYLLGGVPRTWSTELSAALLARPGSVASHQSAAVLHRMRYVERGLVSIIDDRVHRAGLTGVVVHRPRRVDPNRSIVIDGFPVTDRVSTIVDLASVLSASRLERVLDDQLSAHRIELPDMIRAFEFQARRGRKGIANLRSLLEARTGGIAATRSELEAIFRGRVLSQLSAPATFEFLPPWREDGIGRADCAFVEQKVIAEVDGRRWHLRDADFEADHRRDQDALEHGWRTVRYTYRQVSQETPRVIANLRRILELGAKEIPQGRETHPVRGLGRGQVSGVV